VNTQPPNSDPNSDIPPGWHAWAVAFVVGVIALAVRAPLVSESLWVDELHTAWVTSDGLAPIAKRAAMGNQSPVYFYIVWFFTLVGTSEWTFRLPSLLAGIAACGLTAGIAARWTQSICAGLLMGAVCIIDRDWIFYATEARVYSLVQFLSFVQVVVAIRSIEKNNLRDWFLLAGVSILQYYLHFTTLLLTASVLLALFMATKERSIRFRSFLCGVGIGVLMLPSIPLIQAIFSRRDNWSEIVLNHVPWELYRWQTVLGLLVPIVILVPLRWLFPKDRRTEPDGASRIWILAAAAIFPPIVAWLFTYMRFATIFFGRYLIASETLVILLAAAIVAVTRPRFAIYPALVAMLVLATIFRAPHQLQFQRGENWQLVTSSIIAFAEDQPSLAIAVDSGLIETDILRTTSDPAWKDYACLPIESIYKIPQADTKVGLCYSDGGQLTGWQKAELESHSRIVLLIRGSENRADATSDTLCRCLGENLWSLKTPTIQGGLVHWRILTRIQPDSGSKDDLLSR